MYSIKYRAYPTETQKESLEKIFGCTRFVWNHFLAQRKQKYLDFKEGKLSKKKSQTSYFKDSGELTKLKKKNAWLYNAPASSLQVALKNLDGAYVRFFKKQNQFPKFKSKHDCKESFTLTNAGFSLIENKIFNKKFGEIKFVSHKMVDGKIIKAAISKNHSGRYFVSITFDKKIKLLKKNKKAIGLDMGINILIATSDGEKIPNPKLFQKRKTHLAFLQRQCAKKLKGGKNRERAKIKLAKFYERVRDSRYFHIHRITTKLIRENQTICIEDLNVKGMMKNHHLAGSISDASWSEVVRQLKYKSEWYGRNLIQVDRFFPSSKMTHCCGHIVEKLLLSQREITCPICGKKHDRDINAARNILRQGMNLTNGGELIQRRKRGELSSLDEAVNRELPTHTLMA